MSVLIEAFKAIREKHLEAKKIVEEATAHAEKLRNEAEQKASRVYEEAYKTTLSRAEQTAIDLRRKAAKDGKHDLEKFLSNAKNEAKAIEAKARRNFRKAVDSVLDLILQ